MTSKRFVPALALVAAGACSWETAPPAPPPTALNLVLITVDTLRADRVGAYGYAAARTPAIDALAAGGVRFDRAYAPAPITLPSHASMLTGRYPRGHGARHNGMPVGREGGVLTESLARAGFATGAFVSAFPLDRRFGLDRGFQVYSDRLPRVAGRPASERAGHEAVTDALAWLGTISAQRVFMWVHLFEPHAPYGAASDRRPMSARYDDEVAEADRQIARIVEAFGDKKDSTLFVVTSDHGEAFGEHGEVTHSLFVYDTTLRVPLVIAGPGVAVRSVDAPVGLIDLPATLLRLLNLPTFDSDGIDLGPLMRGSATGPRTLYAESFAPLLDFGWSPLRSVRQEGWKLIDAPRPELFHLDRDEHEATDLAATDRVRVAAMQERVQRYSPDTLDRRAPVEPGTAARLRALGYVGYGGSRSATSDSRADPKDRRDLAADLARVAAGEIPPAELEATLRRVLVRDPGNPQAHLRLGFVLQSTDRCPEALKHFQAAIDGALPGADPHLGRAACHASARRFDAAAAALRAALAAEPDNPVVLANLGIVASDSGQPAEGVPDLERALKIDPDFHEARFNLAVAFGRLGRRAEAAREATELLKRLPVNAPQRAEVQRLLESVR